MHLYTELTDLSSRRSKLARIILCIEFFFFQFLSLKIFNNRHRLYFVGYVAPPKYHFQHTKQKRDWFDFICIYIPFLNSSDLTAYYLSCPHLCSASRWFPLACWSLFYQSMVHIWRIIYFFWHLKNWVTW